jgi:hypothetical protein
METLRNKLSERLIRGDFDFSVAFQALKLATNGKLLPWTVAGLLSIISRLYLTYGSEKTAIGLRELYTSTPKMGPETSFSEFTSENLSQRLSSLVAGAIIETSPYYQARKNPQLEVVHRARVTPTGIYFEGPEAEVSNRVLRRYNRNIDSFLRTQFSNEDGTKLEASLVTNLDEIYQRFRTILQDGIILCGRRYHFLGFSSSSLRSQTCWTMSSFLAPDGTRVNPERVIEEIGDFTTFRSPARCAARIGQAFTETSGFISIDPSCIAHLPDVERNGRCFSDGCGTISRVLCDEICAKYYHRLAVPAVLFQIRFMGKRSIFTILYHREPPV